MIVYFYAEQLELLLVMDNANSNIKCFTVFQRISHLVWNFEPDAIVYYLGIQLRTLNAEKLWFREIFFF